MQTLIDFSGPGCLEKIRHNAGVTLRRTPKGLLEVRVSPFAEHGNKWPLIAFGPRWFGKPVNLAGASQLETVLHHRSEGMARVDLQVGTSTDMTRGVDNTALFFPAHATLPARLPIDSIRNNDPSDIAVIQMIFRPRDRETVFRIEPIRLVYDPARGSPAEALMKKAAGLRKQFAAVKEHLVKTTPAARENAVRASGTSIARRLVALSRDLEKARARQFYRAYRSLSQRLDALVGAIGRLRFMGMGGLWVWEPDRYPNIVRRTGPEIDARPLERLTPVMARNEFRDCVVMVSAPERELHLDVALRPVGGTPLPAAAVTLRRTAYIRGTRKEATGEALLRIEEPLTLPAGESRQLWIRFDTRTVKLPPGQYAFELTLTDKTADIDRAIPGELTVWDFELPGYDVLPNNSYAIFGGKLGSGDAYREAVRHMKMYGLNRIFIERDALPRPTGLDERWRITGYRDDVFMARVGTALEAWNTAPGGDTLGFIFALTGFYELGLRRDGYAFPNECWRAVFAQWLEHFQALMKQAGLDHERWMFVLADEAGEPELLSAEIPMAETIKTLDPAVRIISNTSTVLVDPDWSERCFRAFDVFQPNLDCDPARKWLRRSGKPLWTYQCQTGLPAMGRDLYGYYRVYPWDMLARGFVGTGFWTYYSAPHDRPWNEDFQGCQLIYLHPEQGLVHSRRYELAREGFDDYRYVVALRRAAAGHGPAAKQQAETLIQNAVADITNHRRDHRRCEIWRRRIAEHILALRQR